MQGDLQLYHHVVNGPVIQFLAGGQVIRDLPGIPDKVAHDDRLIAQVQENVAGLLFHTLYGGRRSCHTSGPGDYGAVQ